MRTPREPRGCAAFASRVRASTAIVSDAGRLSLIPVQQLTALAATALRRAGACDAMAAATAQALVDADASGLSSHGVLRVPLYCEHLRQGRARGDARPSVVRSRGACCLVDAGGGLAYEAMKCAADEAIARVAEHGITFAGVCRSHHAGAMAYHLRPVAAAGLIGIAFTNSPAAITMWGGKRALFGTNPVAACFPRRAGAPLSIDLSLTEVARGKILLYAERSQALPEGWAFDRDGRPTTDAKAALTGSLSAIGGMKGAVLALVVELLCCSLTGAGFGFENDSYFEPGGAPNIGHAVLAIDPGAVAGSDVYSARIEALIETMLADDGVRLPGARGEALRLRAHADGVDVPERLLAQLSQLAH
jgi:(2R)-3-sulfolactate dehydrogenase (NADP+)